MISGGFFELEKLSCPHAKSPETAMRKTNSQLSDR
jgi:hypothetical protein